MRNTHHTTLHRGDPEYALTCEVEYIGEGCYRLHAITCDLGTFHQAWQWDACPTVKAANMPTWSRLDLDCGEVLAREARECV